MPNDTRQSIDHRSVELDGIRYVILRESVFAVLCRKASIEVGDSPSTESVSSSEFDVDQPRLAQKLVRRRRAAGLSQAELARRAGVRPETLNRIERGRTTPDFATIRKLVIAMNAAEQTHAAAAISTPFGCPNAIEENISSNIKIYPNPTDGIFTLEMRGQDIGKTDYKIEIFNYLGQEIYDQEILMKMTEIDLSNKPKGIYFVLINSEERTYISKIVIQ